MWLSVIWLRPWGLRLVYALAMLWLVGCGGGGIQDRYPDGDLPSIDLRVQRADLALRQAIAAWQADQEVVDIVLNYEKLILIPSYQMPNDEEAARFYQVRMAEFPRLFDFSRLMGPFEKHLKPVAGLYYQMFDLDQRLDTILALEIAYKTSRGFPELLDSIAAHYPANYDFEALLHKPLQRLHKYLPAIPIPAVYTYTPGFADNAALFFEEDQCFYQDSLLAIGLQYFLTDSFPYPPDIPQYLRREMYPDRIPVKAVLALTQAALPELRPSDRPMLLDYMVRAGIRYYLLDVALPQVSDSVKFGWRAEQLAWAQRFEANIFNHLLQKNLLFETTEPLFKPYLQAGPSSQGQGFDIKSGDRLAIWLGWQIVRSYMANNPKVTLPDLVAMNDYRTLLDQAGYKPQAVE